MIFVDTGAWFALIVPSDINYPQARAWFLQNRERLLTTDYVISETLTLCRARKRYQEAIRLGSWFFDEGFTEIHYLSSQEVREAWSVFRTFSDKAWSFTDCTSKVVMTARGIDCAFAFDHHFKQFGDVSTYP